MANFDFSQVTALAAKFATVGSAELPKGTKGAIEGAAYTTRQAWSDSLQSSEVPAAGSTLRYEVEAGAGAVSAVIAATEGTARLQGFVHAREYGSPTVAPASDGQNALREGAADLAKGLEVAGRHALLRGLK